MLMGRRRMSVISGNEKPMSILQMSCQSSQVSKGFSYSASKDLRRVRETRKGDALHCILGILIYTHTCISFQMVYRLASDYDRPGLDWVHHLGQADSSQQTTLEHSRDNTFVAFMTFGSCYGNTSCQCFFNKLVYLLCLPDFLFLVFLKY